MLPQEFIDLTRMVENGMPVFPGHPSTCITRYLTCEADGRNVEQISFGSHSGTHVDVPYHFLKGGNTAETISLEAISGRALLLDFSHKKNECISVADLAGEKERIERYQKMVIRTDWARGGDFDYHSYPFLSLESAQWLAGMNLQLIALDSPSPGPYGRLGAEIHRLLLRNRIYIIEGLTNLWRIRTDIFFLLCLPLLLMGTGGAPCRAVALSDINKDFTNE